MKNLFPFFSLIAILGLASCSKEDTAEDPSNIVLPATYDFENVDYTGQQNRLDMLSEIVRYMKTANKGDEVSATQLQNMFANSGYTWSKPELNNTTKQLANKIADGEQTLMGSYFNDLEAASKSTTPGSNGTAGLVSSSDGSKTYLFDENGHEPLQYIEKVSMGVIFIHQITEVYLDAEKMEVDNETVETGKGTAMQHHWDEAFGYWGVPTDFGTGGFTYEKGAAYDRFWAKYTNGRNAFLDCNKNLMELFIKGRDAINRKDYALRDAVIRDINLLLAKIQAATAIHYLNTANANLSDDALRNHALSEALAFAYGLRFNKTRLITDIEFEEIFDGDEFDNLYEISAQAITNARNGLATAYDLEDIKENL